MIAMKGSSRKKRTPAKKARETFVHVQEQTMWHLVRRDKHEVVLKAVFSSETRRPKPLTFARDYKSFDAKAGRA
ncbi:hypothetical protein HOT31_gp105 [Microbacterium phage Hendrix]|uniref:Uncharacterized protein n=1 Tax=Microbacterium phage Hendrix TaxID=2182341 RepID=A0A2U8UUT9_9CAUD|nr:hypothetical protein HOT31_gp105 [Microbacterium phage Hendrix]AWN07776.1 hypothetical protein PBI_HENDRIX_105 [Microbacterium phage Hendrix]